jgi:hypothetical protein
VDGGADSFVSLGSLVASSARNDIEQSVSPSSS